MSANVIDVENLCDFDDFEEQVEIFENAKHHDNGNHVSVHSSGFRDFLLKPELLCAISDCGFEHPSEIQLESIPQAILGLDVVCQGKSGTGKTAIFVLATLQQLEVEDSRVRVLVICHTRELAFQISKEYERFSKHMKNVRTAVFIGGRSISKDEETSKQKRPHIVVGTPGRILTLVRSRHLHLKHLHQFVVDECDKMLNQLDMRKDIQEIFSRTPPHKQVMMFSATFSDETKAICKKFMNDPVEFYVEEKQLTLKGLQQHFISLHEHQKNRKLIELLDALDYNQVIIFLKSVHRCIFLCELLNEQNLPVTAIHRSMKQNERLRLYQRFKNFESRILVTTNLFGRGIDIERVNVVINYDVPENADTYLHRVARAGRFDTKGLAVTFLANKSDAEILNEVQEKFEVSISKMPDNTDQALYI
ncbi:hypothetical protein HELRODRAFT_83915 [Helobdella robusta]|uniref:RNA helicase n=1 Tax=Helobdella robusta TaxID=6412 RepID=T1G5B8_HELRO|nr:hypothetical protein HELRODRAFT_83915 [Helobdella robusta]ESN99708.1 hypothetical protein HELRODRAFT_83915 [Helobdella robusta]